MIIGLTGASGFLGRSLSRTLTARGHTVIDWRPVRLGDHDGTVDFAKRCEAIVHTALDRGGKSFMAEPADPIGYFQTNVMGSLELIEAAARHDVRRFVFVSSGAVHERVSPHLGAGQPLDETNPLWPASLYGSYKASVETLIHAYGHSGRLSCCTIRPTSIYGVDDPLSNSKWFSLIRDVVDGKSVVPTGGSKSVHVDDVAGAVALVIGTNGGVDGQTYNCCDRMISDHEVATIAKTMVSSSSVIDGTPKAAKHAIDTSKIRKLGMEFGGINRLESTIASIAAQIREIAGS
ncbi:UDP-glucose 4-epimerase [Rubripirellula tenax]|uniref:UDP-glucose 4-epimerase n=1 Tax=Rubripirellula tenax TaxID=2528015 RepID=A0A5C6ETW0_9BACT|nr:SDR family oxidoreductase [Rubripirellula tenax]TWU50781.1 UDP-glucose 4-epimerase [Rubripirellula tenax]